MFTFFLFVCLRRKKKEKHKQLGEGPNRREEGEIVNCYHVCFLNLEGRPFVKKNKTKQKKKNKKSRGNK